MDKLSITNDHYLYPIPLTIKYIKRELQTAFINTVNKDNKESITSRQSTLNQKYFASASMHLVHK